MGHGDPRVVEVWTIPSGLAAYVHMRDTLLSNPSGVLATWNSTHVNHVIGWNHHQCPFGLEWKMTAYIQLKIAQLI